MEDSSQEEKQNYLRENILEKGYDPNQFVSFLQSKKGEAGSDISNWTMEDLKEVVQEFISINSSQSEPDPKANRKKSLPQSKSKDNTSPIVATIQAEGSDKNITLTDEDFGIIIPEFVDCGKSEKTDLGKCDNIEILVTEPKKVDGGFFSKAYITYLITTNPIKANVRRKHDDFVWLRERLSIIFNMNFLPRLPKKGKVNEDKHINKRMRNLERFLVCLAKDPLIKNSQIFFDFLTIETDADFEKRKKIYNRAKTPIELKDIKTIDGKMRINVTIKKEKILENIKDSVAFNETALKKFNQNFKLLREDMKTVISRVFSFGPLFDKLIKISTTFGDNNVIIESYNQMKNIFNAWAETLKKQKAFFSNEVKEYLKFLNGNYHHLKDLVQFVEKIKINYNKTSKSLTSKKMELFRKGDFSSWQLDVKDKSNINSFFSDRLISYKKICFKETNNVIHLKEKYGYHLNKILSEYHRLTNINTIDHKEKVIQFCKKESQISSEYIKIMEDTIEKMEKCVLNSIKQGSGGEKEQPPEEINQPEENNNIAKTNKEIEENPNKILPEKNEEIKNEIHEENDAQKKEKITINEIKEEKAEDKNDKIDVKKEDNVEDKKEENREEKKEEKLEEKKEENEQKPKEENDKTSKEENAQKPKEEKDEKQKEEKIDEAKEEKIEDKINDEKDGQINTEDKKVENNNENKEDKKEEKVEEKNEEKNEEKEEEKKDEQKDEKYEEKNKENNEENNEEKKEDDQEENKKEE